MPPRGSHHLYNRHSNHNNNNKNNGEHLRRPRTSPGFQQPSSRKGSVQPAINPEDEVIAEDEEEEHIELLEYEWPDLPPIPSMKDAVSRRRVSQGISYLLPVDKGRNSINNRFRTDLRAMFQEPYASDDLQYDDNRVKLSAKVHFRSNTADTKWTPQLLRTIPTQLNADSESARKLYVHSAPTGGMASRRMGIDPNKLRKRSNLFLPVKASKAQVSPEIVKLREEATEIIKQGLAYHDDDEADNVPHDDHNNPGTHTITANNTAALFNNAKVFGSQQQQYQHRKHSSDVAQDSGHAFPKSDNYGAMLSTLGGGLVDTLNTNSLNAKLLSVRIHQETFSDYEQLRSAQPPKAVIPQEISSPFLSPEDNQKIWDWLHYGESMTDFDYFLSVCG